MLNEDKLKLMTGIALFEKREGKKIFIASQYFRGDYIGRHMLRSFVGYTFCFFMAAALGVLYKAEEILASLNLDQLGPAVMQYFGWYAAGLVFYLAVTWIVYRRRYDYAVRGMKVYVAKLKRLERRYEFQNKTKELNREVR